MSSERHGSILRGGRGNETKGRKRPHRDGLSLRLRGGGSAVESGLRNSAQAQESDRKRISYDHQELTHEGLVKAFAGCAGAAHQVAQGKGAGLMDAAKIMSGRSDLFEDHVHLSARGSEVISDMVADFLTKEMKSIRPVQAGAIVGSRNGERDHGHTP
jgi:hypothetical protein